MLLIVWKKITNKEEYFMTNVFSKINSTICANAKVSGIVNCNHLINVLKKVYAFSAIKFIDVDPAEAEDVIRRTAKDECFLRKFAKKGKISNGDAVTILEALKWTRDVMLFDKKRDLILCLTKPDEIPVGDAIPDMYDALIISGNEADTYDVSMLCGNKNEVEILKISSTPVQLSD